MPKVVYKYALGHGGEITLPVGAEVICVDSQRDELFLWALISPGTTATVVRTFVVVGTGHPFVYTTNTQYVGTAQQLDGALVWHVFEVTP